jgi:hypothetical protein
MNRVIFLGTSMEVHDDYYHAHVGWDMQGEAYHPRMLKRRCVTRTAAKQYARKFERRWRELHGKIITTPTSY